ncbi:MAG: hypothetical protein DBX00_08720, partial [Verrucomicrobia bacterium]
GVLPEEREALPEEREVLPEEREALLEEREILPEEREGLLRQVLRGRWLRLPMGVGAVCLVPWRGYWLAIRDLGRLESSKGNWLKRTNLPLLLER